MIYLHTVSGDGIEINHTEVTKEGIFNIVVLLEGTNSSLTIEMPEFHLVRNTLTKDECKAYLDLIINNYKSIIKNIKDEDYYTRYLSRVEGVLHHHKLVSYNDYISLITIKANEFIEDYDKQAMNPFKRIVSGIKSSVTKRPDPIAMLREMANENSKK